MHTWSLPERAEIPQATALLGELDAALAAAPRGSVLRIDAGAVRDFDTSAIALLLHAQRGAKAAGLTLQLAGVPAPLCELAQLYGVDELLPSEPGPGPAAT